MRRIDEDHLRKLALEAIEEAAAASHLGPVPRTRGLALALAWLRHRGADTVLPLWPFKSFWESLENQRRHDRWSAVNAAVNAIYLALDAKRDPQIVSLFESQLRAPVDGDDAHIGSLRRSKLEALAHDAGSRTF
jgi:hypothetical protein